MKIKIGEVEGMKKREGREFIGRTERIDECVNRIKYRTKERSFSIKNLVDHSRICKKKERETNKKWIRSWEGGEDWEEKLEAVRRISFPEGKRDGLGVINTFGFNTNSRGLIPRFSLPPPFLHIRFLIETFSYPANLTQHSPLPIYVSSFTSLLL